MKNVFSIDLEAWFCSHNLESAIRRNTWDYIPLRLEKPLDILLALLERHKVQATFFVLGYVAERAPDLVRTIVAAGHEIASHGYGHRLLTRQTPAEFEADLKRSIAVLEGLCGTKIRGYRAPAFTLVSTTLWASRILMRNGIRYDSSVFPLGTHPDYGIAGAPLGIYRHDNTLLELPMSCLRVAGISIPCSGGFYFRRMPYALFRRLARACNRQRRPLMFYLHPWELDPDLPRLHVPMLSRLRHYANLEATRAKLERLLDDFEFTSICQLLNTLPEES